MSGTMRLLAALFLAVTVGAVGCLGPDAAEAALGEEFELAPNQSLRIAGTQLIIGFRRVVEDTRCPIDVDCVVAGAAGVELELFGGSATEPIPFYSPFPSSWNDGTYRVEVLDLQPYRTAGKTISPDAYRLRLVIDLASR